MTFHTQVVGANGQRQAMFIERTPGLAEVILVELHVRPARRDDRLLGRRPHRRPGRDGPRRAARGLRVIAVTSVAQSMSAEPDPAVGSAAARRGRPRHRPVHAARRRAGARSTGSTRPVGPGSTIGAVAIVNCHQGPDRRAPRGARGDATGHHPGSRSWAPSGRGSCSTKPIESMRGGSPVRSTSEEVGDGANERRRMTHDGSRRTVAPSGATGPSQGGDALHEATGQGPQVVAIAAIAVIAARAAARPRPPATAAPAGAGPPAAAAPSAGAPSSAAATRSATRTAAASATASARSRSAPPRPRPLASGKVVRAHRRSIATRTPPASCQDIRDLIAKGVNAIVFNPNDPDGPQPGARRGQGRRHQDRLGRRLRHRPGHLQPVQQPGRVRRSSAPSGCSSRWAARAPSTTCAASPATRPTPTATSASRSRSRTTRTSRSSRTTTASPPAGIRRPRPS